MKLAAIAVLGLLFAANATADDELQKWRIGASLSYSDYETNDGSVSDSGMGIKAHAQYLINEWLGVEGAFYVSPEFKGIEDINVSGGETETTYQGVTLHAAGYLPSPSERIDLFLKGGYFNFYDVNLKVDGSSVDSGSDDGLTLGFGTAFDAGNDIGVRVEFDWYDTSGADLWSIGIGAEYRF